MKVITLFICAFLVHSQNNGQIVSFHNVETRQAIETIDSKVYTQAPNDSTH